MLNHASRRDRDFMRAVRREAARSAAEGRCLTTRQAVLRAAGSPAPSYYVTTEYAWRMLRYGSTGHPRRAPRGPKAEMWRELAARYAEALAARPGEDPYMVLDEMLATAPSSRFFLSPSSAITLYFNILNHRDNGNKP